VTNPHVIRRLIASSALLCAALVPGLKSADSAGATPTPAPPAPERQAIVTAEVQHYNVCGSVCRPGGQAARALELAAWNYNARGSWVISLNEICGTDFLRLADIIGGTGVFVVSRRVADGCPNPGDQAFGNAVIAIGPDQGGRAWYLAVKPLLGAQWPLCPTDRSDHCWTNGRPSWSM
jgi:hypothetical protein